MSLVRTAKLIVVVIMFAGTLAFAQQPASPPATAQPFPLAPPPGPQIMPIPLNDSNDGFVSIFNGTSLEGWEGDSRYWRVEDHEIVGEVTPANLLKQNNFLIWRGGTPANFELKVEFRITAGGNSGINYRSEEIAGTKYLLRGYQADIDGANRYTGQNYEERGRTFLAPRGTITEPPDMIGSSSDPRNFIPACVASTSIASIV